MSAFSTIINAALARRGEPPPKPQCRGRKTIYKTGFNLNVAYDIVPLAIAEGHKVYIHQGESPFDATVNIRIYASNREIFYLKAYAANHNQAEASVDDLIAIAGPHTERRCVQEVFL